MKEITWVDNSNGHIHNVLPDESTYGPRDGIKLGSSRDWLFELWLTRNLIVNRHRYRYFLHCSSTHWNNRGRDVYLLEHNNGELHHPITLEKVTPDSLRVMNRLKLETAIKKICQPLIGYHLRSGLYEYFFVPVDPKDVISSADLGYPNSAFAILKIDNLTVYPSEEPASEVLDHLNGRLSWPLASGVDSILGDWGHRCKSSTFFAPTCDSVREPLPIITQFFNFPRIRLPEHNAICPLDGYITTIAAEHRSPGWTWSARVGRHFEFQICPHCVRVISDKLISMS